MLVLWVSIQEFEIDFEFDQLISTMVGASSCTETHKTHKTHYTFLREKT